MNERVNGQCWKLLVMSGFSLLVGCSTGADSRLIGKWQGRPLATQEGSASQDRSTTGSNSDETDAGPVVSLEFSDDKRFSMQLDESRRMIQLTTCQ